MASQYESGVSQRDAGNSVAGVEIEWQGRIGAIGKSKYELRRIRMEMDRVAIRISGGRMFEAGHISLPIDQELECKKCDRLIVGDTLRFRARFISKESIFPAVGFAVDAEHNKVVLESSLESVALLD